MTQMTQSIVEKTDSSLVMKRTYTASPARLYAAWTQPEQMNRWFRPNDQLQTTTEVDLRVGGSYRVSMQPPEGEPYVALGTYREIVPKEKLVFTWRWTTDPEDGENMIITVEFRPVGQQETELILTHERFRSAEERDNHEIGWVGTFEQLAAAL